MTKEFTEKQIFDYAYCPIYHDIVWRKGLPVGEKASMPKLLDKITNFYFAKQLDDKAPSDNELKRKWDSICNNADIVEPKKVLDGLDYIYRFNRWISKQNIKLVDFNTPYLLTIGNFAIAGNTGIVVEQYNQLCLLIVDFSSRLPEQMILDAKLKYTLDAYVFEKLHQRTLNGILIHNVKNDRDFYTQRNDFDYDRLETSFSNICRSINDNIIYPREVICNTCLALEYCKGWCGK